MRQEGLLSRDHLRLLCCVLIENSRNVSFEAANSNDVTSVSLGCRCDWRRRNKNETMNIFALSDGDNFWVLTHQRCELNYRLPNAWASGITGIRAVDASFSTGTFRF